MNLKKSLHTLSKVILPHICFPAHMPGNDTSCLPLYLFLAAPKKCFLKGQDRILIQFQKAFPRVSPITKPLSKPCHPRHQTPQKKPIPYLTSLGSAIEFRPDQQSPNYHKTSFTPTLTD
jgi:hypothetical protein